jgi:hypothetical protein
MHSLPTADHAVSPASTKGLLIGTQQFCALWKWGQIGKSQDKRQLTPSTACWHLEELMEVTRTVNKVCHNCGLPSHAISGAGVEIRLRLKADKPYRHRDRHTRIWCCRESCAWQALAIAAMGPATHKWQISLQDFVSRDPGLLERSKVGLDRYETPFADPHKQRGCEGSKSENDPPPRCPSFVTPTGRPRLYSSNAERQRAYRGRRRQSVTEEPSCPPQASNLDAPSGLSCGNQGE